MPDPIPTPTTSIPANRVRAHDISMYAAITGRAPVIEVVEPSPDDQPRPLKQIVRNWSPVVLCLELRRQCYQSFVRHTQRPEVAAFIRRVTQSASRQIVGTPRFVASKVHASNPPTKTAA